MKAMRCVLMSSSFEAMNMKFSVKQVLNWQDIPSSLIEKWTNMVEQSKGLDVLYQSPLWFEHLLAHNSKSRHAEFFLGKVTDSSGNIVGLVPMQIHSHFLKFDVLAYSLLKVPLRVASVLGSKFLIPQSTESYNYILSNILNMLPQCDAVYFDCVASDSPFWSYLTNVDWLKQNNIFYSPEGATPYHYILLPGTFKEYLSRFKSKKRYNLNRQVKRLIEDGGEGFKLLRIEKEAQVKKFLEQAEKISQRSWQFKRLGARIVADVRSVNKFKDLARKGILRCYLLQAGEPYAFIVGMRYGNVYHYVEIGYDKSFSNYSPGAVLLYLMVEDLIKSSVVWVNFGIGHAEYKQQFGTHHTGSASVFIMRRTFRNCFIKNCHSGFRFGVLKLRSWLKPDD